MADGTEISENASVSMGDNNQLNTDIPLPELPNVDNEIIKRLIISGLDNIKFAEQGDLNIKKSRVQQVNNVDLLNIHKQINNISDSQYLLWKRMFEIEEGFPAPVDERKALPGVMPW